MWTVLVEPKERAEGRLSNPTPDIDVERAEAALQRALLRLHVTKTIKKRLALFFFHLCL